MGICMHRSIYQVSFLFDRSASVAFGPAGPVIKHEYTDQTQFSLFHVFDEVSSD